MATRRICHVFACLSLWILSGYAVQAIEIDEQRYGVYHGDINGDAVDDIFLLAKDQFVPIHGDILIPLMTKLDDSYLILSNSSGYNAPIVDNSLDAAALTPANSAQFYDYDGDGQTDLVLSQTGATHFNVAVLGGNRGIVPVLVTDINLSLFNFATDAPSNFTYDLHDTSFLPNINNGELVATTRGEANVSNGAAGYRVPIRLPPALNNMAPELALVYSSRRRGGIAGVGWGLSDLSAITRCRASFATEGSEAQDSNPRYSNADRLCLDGRKLEIAGVGGTVNDATYWASGASYRTEIDRFAKVEAFGSHNGAHQYFKVWTKSGRILTFGREEDSQDSRIYAPGQPNGPVSAWALDKVEDRYGNSYSVHYQRNTAGGEYYPIHINFSPESALVFSYQDRETHILASSSDIPWGYDFGYLFKRTKILAKVTSYIDVTHPSNPSGGTAVMQYDINHQRSATTDRYLVSAITEYGFDEFGTGKCARPVSFDWQAGELGIAD